MRPSITFGKIFGIEVGLHYSWLLIALLIVMSLAGQFSAKHSDWSQTVVWSISILTALCFFAALVAHELSHALVARARGISTRSITLFALGGVASIEEEPHDPKTEFWVGIIGPITSAVIGGLCLLLSKVFAPTSQTPLSEMLRWLGYINLTLAAFNLIPGFPLDGGRILRALIWWFTKDAAKSTRTAARVGQFVAICFIGLGIFRFFSGEGFGGLWIAFIGWFLLQAASATRMQNELTGILDGVRVRELMAQDCATVDANANLHQFIEENLLRSGRRCFVVQSGGEILGLITPHEVKAVERQLWPFKTVADVMLPLEQVHTVNPSTLVLEALETMGRDDVNQLPVMSDRHLDGVITRNNILEYLRTKAEFRGRA
jgi:Zn-dependent protease/predicted transcriptional regulator